MADQENSNQFNSSQPVIHRSPWLVQGLLSGLKPCWPRVLRDGAIVAADGMIQSVGYYKDIKREFAASPIQDHESTILVPALINGHCHLELSHLNLDGQQDKPKSYGGDITAWIRKLLSERGKFLRDVPGGEKLVLQHARETIQDMSASGVGVIGDVGNSLASRTIGRDQDIRIFFLLELLGLSKDAETGTFSRLEKIAAETGSDITFTPHAPYSTTPGLIRAMKERARLHKHIVSIHVAESIQEVEFLQTGRGKLREFLVERGAWDGSFAVPGTGPVEYLDNLGVLDDRTLCVHVVQVNSVEINILAERQAKVCLCPGSNRFLGVGKAPVTEFLDHGILPALGTDSRASNEELNMWREMRLLCEDHPGLAPATVFAMATLGGAEALGISAEMGTLEPGKQAKILAVNNKEIIDSPEQVFEFLTTAGETVQSRWLN